MVNKSTEDIEHITTTLKFYSEAFKELNYNKLIKAFHSEAKISYVKNNELIITKPYLIWKDIFNKNKKKDPGIKYDILLEHIDHSNTVAFARMKWLIESPGMIEDIIDYLILMKFDSDWLIFNKMPYTVTISKE
jgi:hypothetical protein